MESYEHIRKLEAISEFSNYSLNIMDEKEHAKLIAKEVTTILDVDACIIRTLQDDRLTVQAAYGVPVENLITTLPAYEGLAKNVFSEMKAQRVKNVVDPEYIKKYPFINRKNQFEFSSYAGAPLYTKNKILGIIGVYVVEEYRDFSDTDLKILQLVANQVTMQMENMSMYRNEVEQKKRMKDEINRRIETEKELIIAKTKAENSEKLKSDFLAQVSHEIRSPLGSMLSHAGLIKDAVNEHTDLGRELSPLFDSIDSAGNRLTRTIDLILNTSEIINESYSPIFESVPLSKVFTDIDIQYRTVANNKGIIFDISLEPAEINVHADRYSFTQIIANLVDNAIKFTDWGRITITAEESFTETIITIRDTGCGMSEKFRKKLFEPFTQEDTGYSRKYDGSGLGMSLVKSYCQINSINLSVESKKNVGTTFRLNLPKSTSI